MQNLIPTILLFLGPSKRAVRQYFPYVSSESDLQRYRAITLQKHQSLHPSRASSSLSNVPSDSTKTKVSFFFQNQTYGLIAF